VCRGAIGQNGKTSSVQNTVLPLMAQESELSLRNLWKSG
jgi:hypothetical protein